MDARTASPWICHVCDRISTGESTACARCYKIACRAHLRWVPVRSAETGLYQLQPVCLHCAVADAATP